MRDFGILGFGAFGRFAAAKLRHLGEVVAWDQRDLSGQAAAAGIAWAEPEEVAARAIVIPAVPVQHLAGLLRRIRSHLSPDTLTVDVASVKVESIRILRQELPGDAAFLATHPLFGPQSGAGGLGGLKIAVCPCSEGGSRIEAGAYDAVRRFLGDELGLRVIEVAAEEHDRQMAAVQALTHFLARAVQELGLTEMPLSTVAYDRLTEILRNVAGDSADLFLTIQRANPFAAALRRELIRKLEQIEQRIGRDQAVQAPA